MVNIRVKFDLFSGMGKFVALTVPLIYPPISPFAEGYVAEPESLCKVQDSWHLYIWSLLNQLTFQV